MKEKNDFTCSILRILVYFDLFHYPLTRQEISLFLEHPVSESDLLQSLQQLHDQQQIYQFQSFYSLHDDPSLAEKRLRDNSRAEKLLKKALRISRFLYQFPFVRAIGISGSLSKNVADENADIDYFMITSSNRLWIARTFLHLFKKLTFLTGHQHYFCMNYFVDEEALKIPEQNFFTAMELVTLVPVCDTRVLESFYAANTWTIWFFPNLHAADRTITLNHASLFKRLFETILNHLFTNKVDNYFLKLTKRRWEQKEMEGRRNMKGNRMGMRCEKHFAKPNPAYLQQQVLQLYTTRLQLMGLEDKVGKSVPPQGNNIVISDGSPGNF